MAEQRNCTCGRLTGPCDAACGYSAPGETVAICEHAFEARHDEYAAGDMSKKVYVRDVCTKCGVTVEREPA